jgi:hypothetical protein
MNKAQTMEFLEKHTKDIHLIHNGWRLSIAKSEKDSDIVKALLMEAEIPVYSAFSEVKENDNQCGVFFTTPTGSIRVAIKSKKYEE